MTEAIAIVLVVVGTAFLAASTLGVLRMPDVLLRLHPVTKAASFGVGLALLAPLLLHGGAGVISRAITTIAFVLLTAPLTAHVIARAAYFVGSVSLWRGTVVDELADVRRSGAEDGRPTGEHVPGSSLFEEEEPSP